MNERLKRKLIKLASPFFLTISDVVAVKNLSSNPLMAPLRNHDYAIRQLDVADLDQVRQALGKTVATRFKERLTSSQGYLAFRDRSIAGWAWTTRQSRSKEGKPPFYYAVTPPKGSLYIYDVYTTRTARNRGVMKAIFSYLLRELKQYGIDCAFFTYDSTNSAMHRLAISNGFITAATLTYQRRLWRVKRNTTGLEKICTSN